MIPEDDEGIDERLARGLRQQPQAPGPEPGMIQGLPMPDPVYTDEIQQLLADQSDRLSKLVAGSARMTVSQPQQWGLNTSVNSNSTAFNFSPPGRTMSADRQREVEQILRREMRKETLRWKTNDRPLNRADILNMGLAEYRDLLTYVHLYDEWVSHPNRGPLGEPAHPHLYVTTRFITKDREDTMLEQLLKLYTMSMATGVTSPMPHFVGPPGSGKSTVFKLAAEMLGVNVHTVNVSRISPLELEGVQMPNHDNTQLNLLHATLWTQLKEGDILLLDEFLRGFPEVYNGLLDILTAREVAGMKLPKVFIAGASNSTVAYDKALEDRLLHIPVPDARYGNAEKGRLAWMLIDALGLDPRVKQSSEMDDLLEKEVLPMYAVLDTFKGGKTGAQVGAGGAVSTEGSSLRRLIGQAQLRHVTSGPLLALLEANNVLASQKGKHHYMFLTSGKNVPGGYKGAAIALEGALEQLTPLQRMNRELNLQLIEMEEQKAKATNREGEDDDPFS